MIAGECCVQGVRLPYKKDGDVGRKFSSEPLNKNNLDVA